MGITSNTAVINLHDFAVQNESANSPIKNLTNHLVRTINRHKLDYNQLKYIFRSARERCDIQVPSKGQKLYQLPTPDEMERFYGVIKNPIHTLIFECLEGTGLRVSELCKLQVDHLDLDNNTIFVKQGKGGKDRVTVISDYIKEKIKLYLVGRNNLYLFESNRHTKYTPRRLQQLCKRYRKAANISCSITCHSFRHLWNTRLAAANVSREKREILAGHAKGSKVQDIYTHLSLGGFKNEIVAILNDVKRGGRA